MSWPWNELGLPGPSDLRAIRSAYAQRLKTTHPEEDPEGFQRLHAAYQEASRYARQKARSAPAEPDIPPPAEPVPRPGEAPEREAADGWDYDALFGEQAEPDKPSGTSGPGEPEREEAPEWDFGELLEEDAGQAEDGGAEEAPQAPEWDFERLFAQGEEEARADRRRKLEKLREKNRARFEKQEREQRRRAADEEDAWAAVMAASHALELLYSSGAPPSQWRRFLESPVFLNVRANLDFVFALEDFLEQRPGLSPEIRRAIFLAYEDCNASKYPAYGRLYKLLDVKRRDRRREARAKSARRNAWRSYPPWRKGIIVVCSAILAVFFSIGWAVNLRTAYQDFTQRQEDKRREELLPQWLEEDFGEPFVRAVSKDVFTPAADPDLYFHASPQGERSESWPGYQTNYPHILVKKALEDFAGARELDLEPTAYTHQIGDAPGAYLLNLPLLGAEEGVAALGELLEELARQDWYQVLTRVSGEGADFLVREPVPYTVYLCHRGLAFYEAPSGNGFNTEEALSLYAQAGPALCRYILEQSGLADKHLGEGACVLRDLEPLELGEGTFFQVSGADRESGEARVRYLLASGGGALFCVPEEEMGRVRSVIDLYRGTPRSIQLDKLGLIMVTDQVPEE